MKTLIVSGVRAIDQGTRSPIELFWTAKNYKDKYKDKDNDKDKDKDILRTPPKSNPRDL